MAEKKKFNQEIELVNWHKADAMEKKLGYKLPWKDLPKLSLNNKPEMKIERGGTLRDAMEDINRPQGPMEEG